MSVESVARVRQIQADMAANAARTGDYIRTLDRKSGGKVYGKFTGRAALDRARHARLSVRLSLLRASFRKEFVSDDVVLR